MGRFLVDRGIGVRLGGLFILALFQQLQLPPQQENFLLLAGKGLVEGGDRVFLEGQLALHFGQLLPQIVDIRHARPPGTNPCFRARHSNILPNPTARHPGHMSRRNRNNSRLVYSTDSGRLCPQCHRPVADCVCGRDRPSAVGDGIVRLQRETKGRGGKAVTVVTGVPLEGAELKALARSLKQKCGVGGSLKGETIEIQGDQRAILKAELEKRGFTVKISGG